MATCLTGKKTREGRFKMIGGKEERGTFSNPDPELGNLLSKINYYTFLIIPPLPQNFKVLREVFDPSKENIQQKMEYILFRAPFWPSGFRSMTMRTSNLRRKGTGQQRPPF
jgi:hypothetical protein